jgi:hypothetical protein
MDEISPSGSFVSLVTQMKKNPDIDTYISTYPVEIPDQHLYDYLVTE